MATTYANAYDATMTGMRGQLIEDYELGDHYASGTLSRSIIRIIRDLTRMERGDEKFVTTNIATGMDSYYEEDSARRWSANVHPDNFPRLFKVVRNTRGYRVERLRIAES